MAKEPKPAECRVAIERRRTNRILVRKLLKRGSFTSVEDLQARVFAFIDYYNLTKPFKWTYQGKA